MGAHTGSEGPRRGRAGKHRRSGQALVARRDHCAPQRTRRLSLPAPSPSALVGLAVLVLIAVGVVHLSGTGSAVPLQTASTPHDEAFEAASPERTTAAATGAAAPPPPSDPAAAATTDRPEIVVHVSGAVAAPGVVQLPGDARVDDALRAAGGATDEADLSVVNLARPLADGEQIHVPEPGEPPRDRAAAEPGSTGGAQESGSGAPIDLNTAGVAELEELPGVGPAIAQRIVEHREKNGSFTSVESLLEVSGIGPATLEEIRGRATV
ncbi:competence protein ComEA [Brachybacterium vulturis]|uniref:Competence protein ComEA n=1 Tax=Brachybacterium vulturis TaxID=2017484 RepID=A0A291GNP0_9MICO|nr:ComEA family DNA-binding protein [Brachybacterium vulturis]ATG51845.1 competence protein ComEA [Brachybacterium vulturis]